MANAGNLTPPSGPVQPTMVTLQEVYDVLQTSSGTPCDPCEWKVAQGTSDGTWDAVLPAGASGYIRQIIMTVGASSATTMTVKNISGSTILAKGRFPGTGATSYLSFPSSPGACDIRFDGGIQVQSDNASAAFIIYYRLDAE